MIVYKRNFYVQVFAWFREKGDYTSSLVEKFYFLSIFSNFKNILDDYTIIYFIVTFDTT